MGEELFNALSGDRTALEVLTSQLFFEIFLNISIREFFLIIIHPSQIAFGANKDNFGIWHLILDFSIPLPSKSLTTFLALTKDVGSTTEKAIKKTSVLGYATDRSRL